jgi:acylphosphatase
MNQDQLLQIKAVIRGRVQGVFFRKSCETAARSHGVDGYVKNLPTGDVEAVFKATPARVKQMIEWCHSGSPHAFVDDVTIEEMPVDSQLASFKILY